MKTDAPAHGEQRATADALVYGDARDGEPHVRQHLLGGAEVRAVNGRPLPAIAMRRVSKVEALACKDSPCPCPCPKASSTETTASPPPMLQGCRALPCCGG